MSDCLGRVATPRISPKIPAYLPLGQTDAQSCELTRTTLPDSNRLAQELAYRYWESGPCYHVLTHGPFSPIGVKDLTAILSGHFSILKCLMSQSQQFCAFKSIVRGVAPSLIRHDIPCLLPCWCSASGRHERSRAILAPKGRSRI